MENPTSNPDSESEFQTLLEQKGIKIIPNIPVWEGLHRETGAVYRFEVGDVIDSGTVMGFAIKDRKFMAIVFDGTKEGEEALTILELT